MHLRKDADWAKVPQKLLINNNIMAYNTRDNRGGNNRGNNRGGEGGGSERGNNSGGGRGFASMDEDRQREIASMGGKAAHEKGTAHEFDSEEAREAGRKGGQASGGNRGQSGGNRGNSGGNRGANNR